MKSLAVGFHFTVREASALLDLFSPVDNRFERANICAAILPYVLELPEDRREVFDCAKLTPDYPFFLDMDGDGKIGSILLT